MIEHIKCFDDLMDNLNYIWENFADEGINSLFNRYIKATDFITQFETKLAQEELDVSYAVNQINKNKLIQNLAKNETRDFLSKQYHVEVKYFPTHTELFNTDLFNTFEQDTKIRFGGTPAAGLYTSSMLDNSLTVWEIRNTGGHELQSKVHVLPTPHAKVREVNNLQEWIDLVIEYPKNLHTSKKEGFSLDYYQLSKDFDVLRVSLEATCALLHWSYQTKIGTVQPTYFQVPQCIWLNPNCFEIKSGID